MAEATVNQRQAPAGPVRPALELLPAARQQPYRYAYRPLVEPDFRRLPGWRGVTAADWASAQWQRAHCVKTVAQLRAVLGGTVGERFYADLVRDQAERATMSMLLPPQMLNTIVPDRVPDTAGFYADPVRRYMLPVFSDRLTEWPSHPFATRDSLHEHDMWAAEGLTHRYPTKVLAELLPTCPQYCGHCTRMDLVGNSTPAVTKLKFQLKPVDRTEAMLAYLRRTPQVRDVVVSGGDVANMPWRNLEGFLTRLLEIENVRDIRLATKALMGLPQHWLQPDVVAGVTRVAGIARSRGVNLAIHTHVNAAQSVTPAVARATAAMLDAGVRDVRNQGVLMRGVNDSAAQLLDLCFALQDGAMITPYYFYLCDMIPNSEHWRLPLSRAQQLQHEIMGYLPGFATPRIVCDVPFVGKRWVHQAQEYDRLRGISGWSKNYRTALDDERPGRAGPPVPLLRPDRRPAPAGPGLVAAERRAGPGSGADAAPRAVRLQRQRPRLVGRGQHDRGPGGDPGGGPDPGQQALQDARGGDPDLEDVVLLPRHRVARLELGKGRQPVRHVVRGAPDPAGSPTRTRSAGTRRPPGRPRRRSPGSLRAAPAGAPAGGPPRSTGRWPARGRCSSSGRRRRAAAGSAGRCPPRRKATGRIGGRGRVRMPG